ncbi:hypothetical protein N7532_002895 [Penicillium argentinense]|uniref:Uncharacterized protein n=1 Tax=Penicillium argentinense TaxID=1131581 RepID=A0A9W9KL21_9EURO|nr:uncharacterized protein N7532_002895 [Penicillium argentinense]KAJ5110250.1 hypothetical protein N7532_002895 [Penicillium argentinense]
MTRGEASKDQDNVQHPAKRAKRGTYAPRACVMGGFRVKLVPPKAAIANAMGRTCVGDGEQLAVYRREAETSRPG